MSNFIWYIFRIKNMSFGEIRYRIQQKLIALAELLGLITRIHLPADNADVNLQLYLDPNRLDRSFFSSNKELKQKIINQADEICQHRFRIFVPRDLYFGENINWHLDYQSGNEWPKKFYAKLSYRNAEVGPSKWIMELNRHHHFFTLGQAYLLTGQEEYAREILNQMLSWIKQNPYLRGIHWYSGMEMALRIISWTWALNAISDFPKLTMHTKRTILEVLLNQAEFISRHTVRYSSANNHLIGEGTGLLIAGIVFAGTPQAVGWLKNAMAILEHEIQRQILPDGMNAEQSTHYLAFVCEFYLICCVVLLRAGHPLPEIFHTRLKQATELIWDWRDSQGNLPELGDSDDGCVYFPNGLKSRFDSILNAVGILNNDFDACCENLPEDPAAFWLWHWHENYAAALNYKGKPKYSGGSRYLASAGYFSMKSSDVKKSHHLIFDCGRLGLAPMAAHAHADTLSFTLSLNQIPLLIDPGTYSYYQHLAWKNYFRGTAAHNTVTIDQLDQSAIASYFLWQNQAKVRVVHQISNDQFDFIVAEHDGYTRLSRAVCHQRQILYIQNNYWILIDNCYGFGRHLFEQNFHFAPQGQLFPRENMFVYERENQQLFLCPLETDTNRSHIYQASFNPIRGWYSPAFHEIEPTTTLTIRRQSDCPAFFGMVLWPGDLDEKPVQVQKLDFNAKAAYDFSKLIGLRIQHSAGRDLFFNGLDPKNRISFEGFEFEGQMCWIRLSPEPQVQKFLAVKAKSLLFNGKTVFSFEDDQSVVCS